MYLLLLTAGISWPWPCYNIRLTSMPYQMDFEADVGDLYFSSGTKSKSNIVRLDSKISSEVAGSSFGMGGIRYLSLDTNRFLAPNIDIDTAR